MKQLAILALLSGCAAASDPGSGPRAAQLAPVCIVWCTAIFERAIGGDLGDLSISSSMSRKRGR